LRLPVSISVVSILADNVLAQKIALKTDEQACWL
jgi:hypothetical protein